MDLIDLAIKTLIFPGLAFISTILMFATWFERKMWARVHLRIGPLHVGKYAGSLQLIADFIKFLGKETIIPSKADKLFFRITPIIAVLVAGLSMAVIPFSENWIVFKFDLSLLFVLAVYSLFPIIILLTGWASNNKYSFIGALRAVFQLLAYWVPLSLSMLGVVMISHSLDLVSIVNAQSKFWFILVQPLGFLVCFISALAESERTPFDIPEAEGEIIWGWMTEYTGINFGLFMVANYLRLYISSLIVTTLFLGGWLGPGFLPPIAWTIIKSLIVLTAIIIVKTSFPRVRMDQLLRIGWRILIPLAILNVAYTLVLIQLIPSIVV